MALKKKAGVDGMLSNLTSSLDELPKTNTEDKPAPVVQETATRQPSLVLSHDEKEARSKRIPFMVTPTMYAKLQKAKKKQKLSVNEILTQLVEMNIDQLL